MKKYIDYAKHIGAGEEVMKWVEINLANFLGKYSGTGSSKNLENQNEIEHILDYLCSDKAPKNMHKVAYEEAKANADKWNKALIKKGSAILELKTDTEVLKDFGDGFKIVKLIGKNAFEREGFLMRHCVASYFGKDTEVYSLRDKDNMPHCTMEKNNQIKGKGNGSIHPKYINYVIAFLQEVGMRVGDNEMKNLGYLNFEEVKDRLHPDTKFINNNYLQEDEKLIGLDGSEFLSPDLLSIKPLIKDLEGALKINYDLSKLIKSFFTDLVQNASSGSYSQNASSGDSSTEIATGKNSVCAAIGRGSKIKAVVGTWITLAEYKDDICILVKSAKIDGEILKENVFYTLKDGEFKEIE